MESKFNKLTPDLMVKDVAQSVRFYADKLGFTTEMLVPENEETVETKLIEGKKYVYAMVRRDEVFFMFMRMDVYAKDLPVFSGVPIGASASFYCDVDKVSELYDSCKRSGVEIIRDLAVTWYGMKEFVIRDCNGYILCFAERQ